MVTWFIMLTWFTLTGISLLYVIWDQLTNTPSVPVMKLAWFLVIIYTGVVGLIFYLLGCKKPKNKTHDAYIQVHWKQALGSEIHCVAGDATAIILAAAILHYVNLPNGWEAIIEYCSAWLFGLLIFQALFMRTMYSSYWEAVKRCIFAETVSMNFIMAGMIPVVLVTKHLLPQASNPFTPAFWGMMSAATIIGSFFAYPINSWLVKKGIKHGMMSAQ